MKQLAERIIFLFGLFFLTQGSWADANQSEVVSPSFDCAKASVLVEELICSDAELAQLDQDIADLYQQLLDMKVNVQKGLQRNWVKAWRKECEDVACLKKRFLSRKDAMQSTIKIKLANEARLNDPDRSPAWWELERSEFEIIEGSSVEMVYADDEKICRAIERHLFIEPALKNFWVKSRNFFNDKMYEPVHWLEVYDETLPKIMRDMGHPGNKEEIYIDINDDNEKEKIIRIVSRLSHGEFNILNIYSSNNDEEIIYTSGHGFKEDDIFRLGGAYQGKYFIRSSTVKPDGPKFIDHRISSLDKDFKEQKHCLFEQID